MGQAWPGGKVPDEIDIEDHEAIQLLAQVENARRVEGNELEDIVPDLIHRLKETREGCAGHTIADDKGACRFAANVR